MTAFFQAAVPSSRPTIQMGTGGSYPMVKADEAWCSPYTSF